MLRSDRVDYTGTIRGTKYPHKIIEYIDYATGYECECVACGTRSKASGQYLTKNVISCKNCKAESKYSFEMNPQLKETIIELINKEFTGLQIIDYLKYTVGIEATVKDIKYISIIPMNEKNFVMKKTCLFVDSLVVYLRLMRFKFLILLM